MESKPIVMLIRLRLLLLSLGSGLTLLLVLCLGAQNLNDRHRLNLGAGQSAPLPSGFIVGFSLALGLSAAAVWPRSWHQLLIKISRSGLEYE